MRKSIEVSVSVVLAPYVEQTLGRLSYLYPQATFVYQSNSIFVELAEGVTVPVREVTYQLYREKIYQESLPMRELLYRTLLS